MGLEKSIATWMKGLLIRIHKNTGAAAHKLRQYLYFLDFEERTSDIYIISYPKSGTTWMQVILHNLLTDGKMDFKHIYEVSPWVKNEAFEGNSPERVNNLPSPRILKSHDKYDSFNRKIKGRFVFLYRNGMDVASSYYHHNKCYQNPDLTFDENFEKYFQKTSNENLNWFQFNRKWLQNNNGFPILYISYNELKHDFERCLEKIASFLEVDLTETTVTRIKKHSSFEYMKEHQDKFGEVPPFHARLRYDRFIRNGKEGEGEEIMTKQQKMFFNQNFEKSIKPYVDAIFDKK